MAKPKEIGWGRRAIERFIVDKETQIEALRQIGIDVALYQELERKAALEAEIRRATLQQEQSSEGKYFRYIKPGKQTSPKERELKNKIATLQPIVMEQRQIAKELQSKISKCNTEIAEDWSKTSTSVQRYLTEDERLEKNGPRLSSNLNKSIGAERVSLETLKARIAHDIAILEKECHDVDAKIADQKTHVEYIRNYERLGLPRDLRKIDQLQKELRRLQLRDLSKEECPVSEKDVEDLKCDLERHVSLMGDYYAKQALKNRVPNGLFKLVTTNRALCREKQLLFSEIVSLKKEIESTEAELNRLPYRRKSAIVKNTLFPKFSSDKMQVAKV